MKKILVPTDFSEDAHNALMVAAQLAKKNNGIIYLIHILELPKQYVDQLGGNATGQMPEVLMFMNGVNRRFKDLKELPELKDIETKEIISSESFSDGIIEKSKELDIDIIIMGSHGTEKNQGLFVGSNTEKIVRASPKPVLIIKEKTDITPKTIVFACKFTEEEKSALKKLTDFSEGFESTIHLLYINTPNNFKSTQVIEKKVEKFMSDVNLKNYTVNIYNDTNTEQGILNFSNKINANLICMGAHERKGISHFLASSLSKDLVHHTQKPIITYRVAR